MRARLIIIGVTFLCYLPSTFIVLWAAAHPCPGAPWGPETYFSVAISGFTIPFVSTCPFPFHPEKGFTDADLYYWPVLAAVLTTGLGITGFIIGKNKLAIIYAAILVASWVLTAFRLGVLPALNSN